MKLLCSPATAQHMAYALIHYNLHPSFATVGDGLLSRAGSQRRVKLQRGLGFNPFAIWAALHVLKPVSAPPSFAKPTSVSCITADLMSPAAENVQQARRLIADLELPAEPCQADEYPNRAPESPLNTDQQAAVNRCRAGEAMPDSWPPQIAAVPDLVQTPANAVGDHIVPKSVTTRCC